MNVQPITDHVESAVSRLMEQYKGQPRMEGLVRDLVEGLQVLEHASWRVANERGLDAAAGETLDAYGTLVGFPRGGLTDDAYRIVLRGVIAENNSDGSRGTAVGILASLFQPDGIFAHNRLSGGNVAYGVWNPKVDPHLQGMMRGVFERSLAAGVRLCFLERFDGPSFAMAGPQGWVAGFNGISATSLNLLPPNVARCGDTLSNVDEWVPCTAGDPFGSNLGGAGTILYMNSFEAGGGFDDTAVEGDKTLTVMAAAGGQNGGKVLMSGLTPETTYTVSYHVMGYQASFPVFAELYWSGGLIAPSGSTGGTTASQFAFSRKTETFTTPAGCDAVELRICNLLTADLYRWRVDALMLNLGEEALEWEDPTPVETSLGGGFGALI